MHYYTAFGLNIHSEIALTELCERSGKDSQDLKITTNSFVIPRLTKTHIYRRGVRAEFGIDDGGGLCLCWKGIANFRATNGSLLEVESLTDDPKLLSLFTVSEALGLILFQKGCFLLHASSVKVGDQAWCFMGKPGAGKSTTAAAFIKSGGTLLSDDLTAITFDEQGRAYIIPAYPQLKMWGNTVDGLNYRASELTPVTEGVNKYAYNPKSDFQHEQVRLRQVLFLHNARSKKAYSLLPTSSIPTECLRNFPLPLDLLKGQALKRHFEDSIKCALSAEIWSKRRPDGFAKLEEWVKDTIEKTNNQANDNGTF